MNWNASEATASKNAMRMWWTVLANRGTDQKVSSSFEQEDGATRGGLGTNGGVCAQRGRARRAVKNAEADRTQYLAWPRLARTGRPGVRAR